LKDEKQIEKMLLEILYKKRIINVQTYKQALKYTKNRLKEKENDEY